MSKTPISSSERSLVESVMIDFTLPSTTDLGPMGRIRVNAVISAEGYKPYPTTKNVPSSLKSSTETKIKSKDLPGYEGEVLEKDVSVRQGKGLQQYVDGQVQEGYF